MRARHRWQMAKQRSGSITPIDAMMTEDERRRKTSKSVVSFMQQQSSKRKIDLGAIGRLGASASTPAAGSAPAAEPERSSSPVMPFAPETAKAATPAPTDDLEVAPATEPAAQ